MYFSIGNLKLLELLEAPFDNISVVSGVLFVLRGFLHGRDGSRLCFVITELVVISCFAVNLLRLQVFVNCLKGQIFKFRL